MARALSHDTRLLILDEPSAVLDQGEVDNLFRVIRDLTAEGVAVVYISHRLEEIRQIGDRITVLKDGSTVATGLAVKDTPTSELIKLMTGRSIEYVFPQRERPAAPVGDARARGARPRAGRRLLGGRLHRATPARSSASPAWSARAARRSSRRCTAPAEPRPAPSRVARAGAPRAARCPRR